MTHTLLPAKIWTMIHNAVAAMPVAEFAERLGHAHQHPETLQPHWTVDREQRTLTIAWAGADLTFGGLDVLAWLVDDTDTRAPAGDWFVATVPDDVSSLTEGDQQ